jgi:cell division protein FtsQ
LLVVLPLLALAWALSASSWLAVDRVAVSGLGRLSEAQVRAVVDVPPGVPLARVDTGRVASAVRSLPPVAAVEVQRSWPGTLRVVVREREAAAAYASDGRFTLVDADAVPFATVPTSPPGVVRLEVDALRRGDPAVRAALQVHAELPADLRRRVRAVRAETPSDVLLLLADDQQVVWGAPGGTATKAAAALALLKAPGDVLDVTSPEVVIRR